MKGQNLEYLKQFPGKRLILRCSWLSWYMLAVISRDPERKSTSSYHQRAISTLEPFVWLFITRIISLFFNCFSRWWCFCEERFVKNKIWFCWFCWGWKVPQLVHPLLSVHCKLQDYFNENGIFDWWNFKMELGSLISFFNLNCSEKIVNLRPTSRNDSKEKISLLMNKNPPNIVFSSSPTFYTHHIFGFIVEHRWPALLQVCNPISTNRIA